MLFSYVSLGHVFVANMTGNVVFLGFALAGVGEISIVASLLAVLAFALGAPSVRVRRLLSIAAMLAGALTGGVLLHWVALAAPLWLAAVLLAVCATGAFLAAGRPRSQAWR